MDMTHQHLGLLTYYSDALGGYSVWTDDGHSAEYAPPPLVTMFLFALFKFFLFFPWGLLM